MKNIQLTCVLGDDLIGAAEIHSRGVFCSEIKNISTCKE